MAAQKVISLDKCLHIEAKYLTPPSLKTTHDIRRDQVIRYLDLEAYHFFLIVPTMLRSLDLKRSQLRTESERKLVDDLIVYLDYKIREAERIRNGRKQLSFW